MISKELHVATLYNAYYFMQRAQSDLCVAQLLFHTSRKNGWDMTVHQRELYYALDRVHEKQEAYAAAMSAFFWWLETQPKAEQIKAIKHLLKTDYKTFIMHRVVQKWIADNAALVSLVMAFGGSDKIDDGVKLYEQITTMATSARIALISYAKYCNRKQGA